MDLYFIFLLAIIAECSFINPNHSTNFSAVIGPVCLDSDLWSLPTFSARDCQIALQNLLNGDVSTYGEEVFDFMVAGATSRTRLRKVQLPAAYDYGTCTLAVAMLATIPVNYMPPIPPGTFFPETDRTTYEILSILARRIKQKCVDGGVDSSSQNGEDFLVTLPGWITAGSLNAIGVFFFDSRSFMRRIVLGGLNSVNMQSNGSLLGFGMENQSKA